MAFADLSLKEFSEEVASSKPTPGGGSVAALSAALSSALLKMVIVLTKDNNELDSFKSDLKKDIKDAFHLMDKDSDSFNKVMKAFKMSKETESEKEKRKESIQAGLKEASLTPLDTMKLAYKLIEVSIKVARHGNKNAVTDAGVAGYMAFSALQGGYYNVIINTASIKDEKFVDNIEKEAKQMLTESKDFLEELNETVINTVT
ncbi:MAG: cyclodeaminase/cyclohydrolase family protein [Halarsenatibacteraceae bacterium]